MNRREYYLYRHVRLDKNEPFYVGVGTKPINYKSPYDEYKRAFSTQRSGFWFVVTKKTEYEVEILFESSDLDLIYEKEKEFISLYGRKDLGTGTLCNLTDGGVGTSNPKNRKKRTRKRVKRTRLSYLVEKWGETKGHERYEKWKRIASEHGKRIMTDEHKQKMYESRLGWYEAVRNGSVTHPLKGICHSVERVEKMRDNLKGRRLSEETEFKERPIVRISHDLQDIKKFSGAQAASYEHDCTVGLITSAIRGRINTGVGFYWCYLEDMDIKLETLKREREESGEPIICFKKEENGFVFHGFFENKKKAVSFLELKSNSVLRCLEGKLKTTGGYKFYYISAYERMTN